MARRRSEPGTKAPSARSAVQLNDRQRLSWLRLLRSENVGPATFRALVNQFGGAEAALAALPALSRRGGRASIRVFTEAEAEAEVEAADRAGAHLVAMGETGYPPALTHVDAPPATSLCQRQARARGGSHRRHGRRLQRFGRGQKFTRQLATELGLEGFVIASGLARGIDTAAILPRLSAVPSPFLPVASSDKWQSGGLGNRFKLVNQRGDILRSLSPCHIGFR